jgi:uncharacterized protein YqeY
MGLMQQVEADLVKAMKAQEKVRTGALRMLKSALKNAQIEAGTLDDAAASQVVMKLCKQRKESIEIFEKNARQELADQEKAELAVIEAYLPKGLSDEELGAVIDEVIAAVGGADPKKVGPVVGAVMKKLAGQPVDGKKVNELVRSRLGA